MQFLVLKKRLWGGGSLLVTSFIESLAVPAVNVFILISGYFLCSKKSIDISKPISLLLQLVIFKELLDLVMWGLPYTPMSFGTLAKDLLPVSYFVVIYIAMYILSPYINIILCKLSHQELKKFLIITGCTICLYPYLWDVINEVSGLDLSSVSPIGHWGNQCGHTIVHFIFMYCIGAYIRTIAETKISVPKVLSSYVIVTLIMTGLIFVEFDRGVQIADSAVFTYINPLVIIQSVCLLLLFKQINIKSRIINWLASLGFITYIICGKVYKILSIDIYTHQSYGILLLHLFITVICTFVIAAVLNYLYQLFFSKLINLFKRNITYYE